MKSSLSRRDFLRLAGLLSAGYVLPQLLPRKAGSPQNTFPGSNKENTLGTNVRGANTLGTNVLVMNVLVIVFDAWTAADISLYGYGRQTTPNIERLAQKAIVYHDHHSGGNFTNPGTASLLTGTLPWTHHALEISSTVDQALLQKSLFHTFSDYYRLAYSHNPAADMILDQFAPAIEDLVPWNKLYLDTDLLPTTLLKNDEDVALVSWSRALKRLEGYSYSLYLSNIYTALKDKKLRSFAHNFPRGLPSEDYYTYFTLEQAVDFLFERLKAASHPFLGYYHFFPPHSPYRSRQDFYGRFDSDDFHPVEKPYHIFRGDRSDENIRAERRQYDEYILYVDSEFNRLYQFLEDNGYLENTWLVLTSDHGELFERGIHGHITEVLYEPLIHIPLLIFPPGNRERVDVYDTTSAVDVLPTLAHLTGHPIPEWVEGTLLPPFAPALPDREVYCFHGAQDDFGKLVRGTATLLRNRQKTIWYFGYDKLGGPDSERIEAYDLAADPEELNDLYPTHKDTAEEAVEILKARLKKGFNAEKSNPTLSAKGFPL